MNFWAYWLVSWLLVCLLLALLHKGQPREPMTGIEAVAYGVMFLVALFALDVLTLNWR